MDVYIWIDLKLTLDCTLLCVHSQSAGARECGNDTKAKKTKKQKVIVAEEQ